MAAVKKKAPAKKASAKRVMTPAKEELDLPKLTQEELLRLRLHDAQARLALQDVQITSQAKGRYLEQIDPQKKLAQYDQTIAEAHEQHKAAKTAYALALETISKRIGVDLGSGCAIDPETGTVIRHEAKKE